MEANILFYVSGHGFGHSVREIGVIDSLNALMPDLKVSVRTSAPRWLYERGLNFPFDYYEREIDPCIVQDDAFSVDIRGSFEKASDFYKNLDSFVDTELGFIRNRKISMLVSDIAPAPFEIARRAGIPGVAIANFTWDWIYSSIFRDIKEAETLVKNVGNLYRNASAILATPLKGGLDVFENVIDIPFIVRSSTKSREEMRDNLGIPKTSCLVLLSFGGFGPGYIDVSGLGEMEGYYFVSLTPYDCSPPNVKSVPRGLYEHQDLVAAADIVVGKPGYGIVSECASCSARFLYTDRNDFPEYDVIVDYLEKNLISLHIPLDDIRKGNLLGFLERIRLLPSRNCPGPFDGGRKAAAFIMEMLINQIARKG